MLRERLGRSLRNKSDRYSTSNPWHSIVLLLVMLVGLVSTGCRGNASSDDPLADHSFLTQQPCASPCWYGLVPDKSRADEAYATLKTLPFLDPTTKEWGVSWPGDDNASEIGFNCLHPKETACGGSAIISQGILKRLDFSPPRTLSFQEAVKVLDPPDYMNYGPASPGGGCFVTLFWAKKGVYLSSIDSKNEEQCREIQKTGHVASGIVVTHIYYVTAELLASESKDHGPDKIPWPGFANQ